MKDYLIDIVSKVPEKGAKINIMREYLQIYALRTIYEKGFFKNIAFVGGTALRFVHGLPRFSEDIDFSLAHKEGYDFEKILGDIKRAFVDANYQIAIKVKTERTVHSAFLKFPELMFLSGLTHRRDQNLSIKVDVDTNPPSGAILSRTLVNKYFPVTLTHYDLPSLFAGKLHAILTRPYVKGRDYFDLFWILSRWNDIVPNMNLLTHALAQTGYKEELTEKNWKEKILEAVKKADWNSVMKDVSSFVEDISYINAMRPENIEGLLSPK